MKVILLILSFIGILGCTSEETSLVEQEQSNPHFELYDLFQSKIDSFRTDNFEINHLSTEGGHLAVFHNIEDTFMVFDFWIYGEMGRSNHLYITDDHMDRLLFYKVGNITYDKPFYLEDYTKNVNDSAKYLGYSNGDPVALYSADRELLSADSLMLSEMATSNREMFREMVKEIEILK